MTYGPHETPQERAAKYRRSLEARNPATSSARLRELSIDPVRPVRLYVARNRNSPPDVLSALALDEDLHVRWNILANPNTPEAGLRQLAEAEAEEVAARNPVSPWFVVRSRVLAHRNAGRRLRRELIRAGVPALDW